MNIKRYILLLIFAGLMVGCLPVISVEFDNSGGLESVCWIHVDSDNNQPVFHTSPGGSIVSVTQAMALPPDINDENDYIVIDVSFAVLRYAVASDGYWFEVNIEGLRYFEQMIVDPSFLGESGESQTLFFGIPGETIYEEEGNIATGIYWIPQNQVSNMSDFEDMNCIPELEDNGTLSDGLPQVYYCSVSQPPSDNFSVEFRIGPGMQRSVRFIAVEPFSYDAHGYAVVDDVRWLQVHTADYGLLWVNESHVATEGNCSILNDAPIPPTLSHVTSSSEEGTCDDFYILSPLGQVAEENSVYSWTAVDDADEYVLVFSNYLSEVSDVITVDGSQTSVEIYTGSLNTGSLLDFDVSAMKNGEVLCTTAPSGWIERLAPQAIEEPEPTATPEKKDKKKNGGGYTPPSEEDYSPPDE